jgi:DNA-binding transcriptional ArsR family regulator
MSDVFAALAHPVRRRILAMLRERAMSAGEIAAAFDLSKPTLSGHFAVLKEADLVSVERKGASLIYRINLSVAEDALAAMMEIFRIGDPAPKQRAASARSKGSYT